MITVVVWKWGDLYKAEHVNIIHRALTWRLKVPYEFVCITDDISGLAPSIRTVPIKYTFGKRNGRRLWIFSEEARQILGSTILQIDLDMVITGDLTPLIADYIGPFQIWKCKMSSRYQFGLNPSFMMLEAGYYDVIWREFQLDPDGIIDRANRAGWPASDQAVISHKFTTAHTQLMRVVRSIDCMTWGESDGIISLREDLTEIYQAPHANAHTPLPPYTRLVSFHGQYDPAQFLMLDWVRENWA